MSGASMQEKVRVPSVNWRVGPYHADLPGPFRLNLEMDGEIVASVRAERGFAARGLESVLSRSSWLQCLPILDRLDPDAAIYAEWAYCLAVEKALGVEVPARGREIRVLLSELFRVSSHLLHLARVAHAAGSEITRHFMLREREQLLDLKELLTGARHAPAFLRVGGVREDVSDGFLERLIESCQTVRRRITEYNDLLTYNEAFVRRVLGMGVMSAALISRHGISGIPARAHDPSADLRWKDSALGYEGIARPARKSVAPKGTVGDIHHRFVLRLSEALEGLDILEGLSQHISGGEHRARLRDPETVPSGTYSQAVESARGQLKIEVSSSGGSRPTKVVFMTPSDALFEAMPEYLLGAPVEDLGLWLASYDIQIAEVDR